MIESHPAYKPCKVCGKLKHRQLEFHKNRLSKDGRKSTCKTCYNLQAKIYRMQPDKAEQILINKKRYNRRRKVKERDAWSKKLWYSEHQEFMREYHKLYYRENKAKIQEQKRRYKLKRIARLPTS